VGPSFAVHRVWPLVVALLAGAPSVAIACLCARPSCGAVLEAGTLFEGTVESVAPAGNDGLVVRFRDVRGVRGPAPTFVTTASDGGACGYDFVVGRRYLVDARARPSGRFGVSLCSLTRSIERAHGLLALLAAAPEARRRVFGQLLTTAAGTAGRGDGPPIEGALVRLSGPVEGETTTSANGDFAFAGLPDGAYRVHVTLPEHRRDVLPPPAATVTLGSVDLCASVDLVAASTARVSGTVVDAAGAPVSGVRVELYPWPYDQWAGGLVTAAVSDASGRYTIDRVPPGRYAGGLGIPFPSERNAIAPALLRAPDGEVALTVGPGAALEMPPLVATPAPPVAVTGRVTAPAGLPVDGLELVLHPLDGFARARTYGGKTMPGGRFELRAHRGVRYRVTAEARQGVVGEVEFVAGDDEIEIVLRAPR
jgi:hypothetical protein